MLQVILYGLNLILHQQNSGPTTALMPSYSPLCLSRTTGLCLVSVTLWTLPWEKQQACSMVTIVNPFL